MPAPLALVAHPACARHDTGPGHPESPARLEGILSAVRGDPALERDGLRLVEPVPAGVEDLERAHDPTHVARVRALAERAEREGGIAWADPDTAVSPASYQAALAAAGCAISAAELVARGEARGALALARPPGHHAGGARAAGFCLFNNVVVAARRVQALRLAERVLVVDWDVHHGDGTQAILWEDPTCAYLSLHLYPHYPGTGAAGERGGGAGEGHVRNVPLPHGTTRTRYRRAFSDGLEAALRSFSPDLVLVSAGFDCLAGDPLGGLDLEPGDLHALTVEIADRTRGSAAGRVAAVLEGGYLPARMGAGAVEVLRGMGGLESASRRGE
jgi:acetoin utilization deacetylase AcuC-like enzyme